MHPLRRYFVHFQAVLVLIPILSFSQNIDSLKAELKKPQHDSVLCNILSMLAEGAPDGEWERYNLQLNERAEKNLKIYSYGPLNKVFSIHLAASINNFGYSAEMSGDFPKASEFYNKSLAIAEKINDPPSVAIAYHNLGAMYKNKGEIDKALEYFNKSIDIGQMTGDKKNLAYSYHNIGAIHYQLGNIPKALDYYNRSLRLHESIGERIGAGICLTSIAFLYLSLDEDDNALLNFQKSLKICDELGDLEGQGSNNDYIGVIYGHKGKWEEALAYHQKAISISEKMGHKAGLAISYHNISIAYKGLGNNKKALESLLKSLELHASLGNRSGTSSTLYSIGQIYFSQKDHARSVDYGKKAFETAVRLGFPRNISDAADLLYKNYKVLNDAKEAYKYYEIYIRMNDSLSNAENKKVAIRNQLKYEYETKAATDSILHAKENEVRNEIMARKASELRAEQNRQYFLYGGIGLFVLCSGFLYNRFRFTQKQKNVIEVQKKVVEEKQLEVLDSIHYAKRIQSALMTNEKYIDRNLEKLKNRA
jgi:tetratricopeptide (TPR) repeat protein